jgi:hypothetical protein
LFTLRTEKQVVHGEGRLLLKLGGHQEVNEKYQAAIYFE